MMTTIFTAGDEQHLFSIRSLKLVKHKVSYFYCVIRADNRRAAIPVVITRFINTSCLLWTCQYKLLSSGEAEL